MGVCNVISLTSMGIELEDREYSEDELSDILTSKISDKYTGLPDTPVIRVRMNAEIQEAKEYIRHMYERRIIYETRVTRTRD